jgi:hypothetical protein
VALPRSRKKRPGDPWLLEYEEQIILEALQTLRAEHFARLQPKFLPHPTLGPMFSALSENVSSWARGEPLFRAEDLIERWPMRFTSYVAKARYGYYPSHRRAPSIHLRSTLKRMSEGGALVRTTQGWRRNGKVRYRLKEAA